ncbi:MAG: IS4 family transposase [Verrucomicrobiales bacterium]|nr:IS4 family transposase [Verrucomicrobiales bacterium]
MKDSAALDVLAKKTQFQKRKKGKLTPAFFLAAMMQASQVTAYGFRQIALFCGLEIKATIAKQSLWERVNSNAFDFLSAVLCQLMHSNYESHQFITASIKRILVVDSTVLKLHPSLVESFPGSKNQYAKTSQSSARVQVLIDIFSGDFLHFNLSSFRRNDQGSAMDVVTLLEKGDLLLRDLGYFTLASLQAIHLKGAFFVTRHLSGIGLYDDLGEKLDIHAILDKGKATGQKKVRFHALLGQAQKTPVIVEAILLPEHVSVERRRKAKANRDKRLNYNAKYYNLLDWSIVITNIAEDELEQIDVYALYSLRWRIENIFKAWKSNLLSTQLSNHKTNVWHMKCLLVSHMIVLVKYSQLGIFRMVFSDKSGSGSEQSDSETTFVSAGMSMFKTLDTLLLCQCTGKVYSDEDIVRQLNYHGVYEKRRRNPMPKIALRWLT